MDSLRFGISKRPNAVSGYIGRRTCRRCLASIGWSQGEIDRESYLAEVARGSQRKVVESRYESGALCIYLFGVIVEETRALLVGSKGTSEEEPGQTLAILIPFF